MNNTKVFRHFKGLSKKEYKEFLKYLRTEAPRKRDLQKLFILLDTYQKSIEVGNFSSSDITKLLYQRIKGKTEKQLNSAFRDLCTVLCKHLNDFFDCLELKDNDFINIQLRLAAVEKRNSPDIIQKDVPTYIKEVNKNLNETDDYFLLHRLHHSYFFHSSTDKYKQSANESINATVFNLDVYYCIQRLEYMLEQRMRLHLFAKNEVNVAIEQLIVQLAQNQKFTTVSIIRNYLELLNLLSNRSQQQLAKVKAVIYKSLPFLSDKDQHRMFTHLINLTSYLKFGVAEVLKIYKECDLHNMLVINNKLNEGHFLNAVYLATVCKDLKWAVSFIKNNTPYLKTEDKKVTIRNAECLVYFEQGKYKEVIGLLSRTKNHSINYTLRKYPLLIKANFENFLSLDYDTVEEELKLFSEYLKNEKELGKDVNTGNRNFITRVRFLKKLFKRKKMTTKQEIDKKYLTTSPCIEEKWLQEKAQQLLSERT